MDILSTLNNVNSAIAASSKLRELSSHPEIPYGTDSVSIFQVILDYIDNFQNELDSEHEASLYLANFGQNILLDVTQIVCEPPSLIVFKGFCNGKPSTLIQHIDQLNFLLTSVEKKPDLPKRKIGFSIPQE